MGRFLMPGAVRELGREREEYSLQKAFLFTNGDISDMTYHDAAAQGVTLMSDDQLKTMIKSVQTNTINL